MTDTVLVIIYLFYGLAFFSMGLAIIMEIGHGSDPRLKHALRPLASFGLLHGLHEWIEMFERMGHLTGGQETTLFWAAIKIGLLAFSFLSLGAFGASLLAGDDVQRRLSLIAPAGLAGVWGLGILLLREEFAVDIWDVADVWTRYSLAIPASLFACIGLIALQRAFRKARLARFGRDSLWAAVAFLWYGLAGQIFTRPSSLPPSTFLNNELFLDIFGFPVQFLRASAALVAAIFVMRVLRSFEVETKRRIEALQNARLEEVQHREALRSEYLRRVVDVQERERQRIARELHDETGQALTAIGLGIRGATATLRNDKQKAAVQLRSLEGLIADSLNELQRLIADLRPSHLDDLGLPAALRWYAGELQKHSELHIAVHVEGVSQPISAPVKTALFRVAQEALVNVIKHANATSAKVKLVFKGDEVALSVEDDGCGFEPGKVEASGRKSWGLMGMEERAHLLDGDFRLESLIGEGTLILVEMPNNHKEVKNDDPAVLGG